MKKKRKFKIQRKHKNFDGNVLRFGKYEGRQLSDCPSSYLKFLAENMDDGLLCYAADDEYQTREKFNTHWEEYDED